MGNSVWLGRSRLFTFPMWRVEKDSTANVAGEKHPPSPRRRPRPLRSSLVLPRARVRQGLLPAATLPVGVSAHRDRRRRPAGPPCAGGSPAEAPSHPANRSCGPPATRPSSPCSVTPARRRRRAIRTPRARGTVRPATHVRRRRAGTSPRRGAPWSAPGGRRPRPPRPPRRTGGAPVRWRR